MSSPFSAVGISASSWVPLPALVSTFIPFPSPQDASDEIGYGEGGYGQGGYDTPSLPAIFAPTTNWVPYTTK